LCKNTLIVGSDWIFKHMEDLDAR